MQTESLTDKYILDEVLKLARSCRYEAKHSQQVAKLSLKFFDELKDTHKVDNQFRILLEAGAVLHDIGWIKGRASHHKTGRDIILQAKQLPFNKIEKIIVALLARYHRKALPSDKHKYYEDLSTGHKQVVQFLSALLRLADGLDREHRSSVEDLSCQIFHDKVIVKIQSRKYSVCDQETGLKKADLFIKVFKRSLIIERK